jgi:hypothetical protein
MLFQTSEPPQNMSLNYTLSAAVIAIITPTYLLDASSPDSVIGLVEGAMKLGVPGLSLIGLYFIWRKSEAGDALRTKMHEEQLRHMSENSEKIEQLLRETLVSKAEDRKVITDLATAIRSVPCKDAQQPRNSPPHH